MIHQRHSLTILLLLRKRQGFILGCADVLFDHANNDPSRFCLRSVGIEIRVLYVTSELISSLGDVLLLSVVRSTSS